MIKGFVKCEMRNQLYYCW